MMSRRLNRSGLFLVLLFASEVWALGLGDIRLDSALNEPLRAEIDLVSATAEELENLKITLASNETFERYGIDRPLYLSSLVFDIQNRGGNRVVVVTSSDPITEPFVTFLVEAVWSRGRLLREYTVLLDPPTFAPAPATRTREQVAAPQQPSQADRGRIERAPATRPAPATASSSATPDFDATNGGDYQVSRGDNLWRIAERVRPDNRLSMNQTMLAIYEANPNAFAGNINVLRANTRLRIPSADEIFSINRRSALSEIQRQNQAWTGDATASQPSLTLVPPDRDQAPYSSGSGNDSDTRAAPGAPTARIRQLEERIAEQESLLEIRDSELAQLRSELARMRAERAAQPDAAADTDPAATAEPAVDAADDIVADDIFVDEGPAEPAAADDSVSDDSAEVAEPAPAPRIATSQRQDDPGLVDTIIGALTSVWGLIGIAVLAVIAVLAWFVRRASGGDEAESTGVWDALDAEDDVDSESMASTERLRALARDDDASIVVVEQQNDDTVASEALDDTSSGSGTFETPSMGPGDLAAPDSAAAVSLEDTFSSETAINLDQSDPIAEADFHMAYGLYDQAADLINGALAIEPKRTDLLSKLCEIYFVWGNRDAFVDAATRLKNTSEGGADWDKIVIMGQQIAGDHALFSNVSAGVTREVDLDFESSGDDAAALDIDFADSGPDGSVSEIVDFGEGGAGGGAADDDALDFGFDETTGTSASITQAMPGSQDNDATVESATLDVDDDDATAESPTIEVPSADDSTDSTVESPTIEQRADELDSTSELPAMDDDLHSRLSGLDDGKSGDQTAEIDLDDLGLDLEGLAGDYSDDTGVLEGSDSLAETGRNEQIPEEDNTGRTDVNVSIDGELLDATGQTQVLSDDFSVDTTTNADIDDDDATMLSAGLGGDEPDFDFAKTEALPGDSFDEDTAESRSLAGSTDMDLDLDDLTAALKQSEAGDTIEQNRDDATVEQPRPGSGDNDLDFDLGLDSDDPTQALGPDDVSDDLQDARTMTEVGTKLDLARAYVDMGDPGGARNILEEVIEEGDNSQKQQAKQLLDSLPG